MSGVAEGLEERARQLRKQAELFAESHYVGGIAGNFGAVIDLMVGFAESQGEQVRRETMEQDAKLACHFCAAGTEMVGKQHRLDSNTSPSGNFYVDCAAAAIRSRMEAE